MEKTASKYEFAKAYLDKVTMFLYDDIFFIEKCDHLLVLFDNNSGASNNTEDIRWIADNIKQYHGVHMCWYYERQYFEGGKELYTEKWEWYYRLNILGRMNDYKKALAIIRKKYLYFKHDYCEVSYIREWEEENAVVFGIKTEGYSSVPMEQKLTQEITQYFDLVSVFDIVD